MTVKIPSTCVKMGVNDVIYRQNTVNMFFLQDILLEHFLDFKGCSNMAPTAAELFKQATDKRARFADGKQGVSKQKETREFGQPYLRS